VEPIRVLVADDHPLFRDGLRGLLASRDGFEVVGEAASGEEAVAAERSKPFPTWWSWTCTCPG
jgi:DNA-binding NarL/FixJ family response regulator